ncbi:MAG: tetratricopeptide repeat protein, partial [Burkholderiaceae bacterium]
MSLINRMLQDLDSRGTDSVGTGAMYAQIRSVPEAPKRHVSRWIWLAVPFTFIIAIMAWQWLRHAVQTIRPVEASMQTSNAIESSVQTSLIDLKLSSDLSIGRLKDQARQSQNPSGKNDSSSLTSAGTATTASAEKIQTGQAENSKNVLDKPLAEPAKNLNATISASNAIAVPVSISVPQKERVTTAPERMVDTPPVSINKQINELTVQQRAENEYRKALLLVQQGKPMEAIAGMEQALQLDRQMVSARQTLAGLLIDAKRPDEAAQRLQDGLAIDPAQAGLAMILARLQVEKGELRRAIETLQRTLPYAAERSDYQAFLAALFQRDGRHKDTIEHYALALRQNPQNGVWWMGLGISLQAENRLSEAQEAFTRAKASNMLSPELLVFVDQ